MSESDTQKKRENHLYIHHRNMVLKSTTMAPSCISIFNIILYVLLSFIVNIYSNCYNQIELLFLLLLSGACTIHQNQLHLNTYWHIELYTQTNSLLLLCFAKFDISFLAVCSLSQVLVDCQNKNWKTNFFFLSRGEGRWVQ